MKQHNTIRSTTCTLLSGMLLAACGGVPEEGLAPAEELLGTQESAMCVGLSVPSLSIEGVSWYDGVTAGGGSWSVSPGANAVRMEYYVDGVLKSSTEYPGTSGTWNFSSSGALTCAAHSFAVKAYPMIIDSAGVRTTCFESPKSATTSFNPYCSTLSCSRISTSQVSCTGSVLAGASPYTAYWRTSSVLDEYSTDWSQGTFTRTFGCGQRAAPTEPVGTFTFQFQVRDAAGNWSNVSSKSYSCVYY